MRNNTLKKRNLHKLKQVRKNSLIQELSGQKYVELVQREFPQFFDNHQILSYINSKPKSTSFRNWVYPALTLKLNNLSLLQRGGITIDEVYIERIYQEIKEWHDNQTTEITIEISGKMQHLAMCFDSPHFESCGSNDGMYKTKADRKINHADTFCIFIRDRSGKIQSRRILRTTMRKLFTYSFYGTSFHAVAIDTVIKKITEQYNLQKVPMGSFL